MPATISEPIFLRKLRRDFERDECFGLGPIAQVQPANRTYGIRGLKFIRGDETKIILKPMLFWGLVSVVSQFLLYYFPQFSYQTLAVKDVRST